MSTNSYRQIIRSTGITGIAQAIQIILKIIGNKCIAVLIGPAGIGVMILFQSTVELINVISGMGIGSAAVRDIAYAAKKAETNRISVIITVLKRLCFITGITGTIFIFITAHILSYFAFQSYEYTLEFRLISIVILITHLAIGKQAILQGYRKLKSMAYSSTIGSAAGLLFTIPLFFLYGEDAIVPSLIIQALLYLILSYIFSKKIQTEKISITVNETFKTAKGIIALGLVIMGSGLFILISVYQIRILISNELGIFYVGIFQAGWGIQAVYLQMLFQAMSRDYFPRLAALKGAPLEMNKLVNEQLHISILIAAPLISIMLLVSPFLIHLMYSAEFYTSVTLLQWLLFGTLLKLFSWPIAFIMPALNASKIYLATEAVGAFGIWVITWFLIDKFGIESIGIAFIINYLLYNIIVFVVAHKLIEFKFDNFSIHAILISLISISLTFILQLNTQISYILVIISIFITFFTAAWSIFHLNRLLGLKKILLKRFENFGKRSK